VFHVANAEFSDFGGNAGTELFVADILSGTTGNTGMVDVSAVPAVPEPGTLLLLGSGLVTAGAWTRRRMRRRA
jgi:hypothetical protein